AAHIARKPNVRIAGTTRLPGTPAARIAVISPSVDMRLSVIRAPTNTPKGMANGSACGRTNANRYPTVEGGPELRTRNSNKGLARCRNNTKVNSTTPRTALTKISRKMVRLSKRINVSVNGTLSLVIGSLEDRPLPIHQFNALRSAAAPPAVWAIDLAARTRFHRTAAPARRSLK